jgi:RNA polymerase sigma factor (sigma-70 family)
MKKDIFLHRQKKQEKKCEALTPEQAQLVADNVKLVPYLVGKFSSAFLAHEDQVAECNYLLCRVAKVYRAETGWKFSTIMSVSWRRHLGRISAVYSASKNGYRNTGPWRQTKNDEGDDRDEDIARINDPTKPIELREEMQILKRLFRGLQPKYRRVLKLRYQGHTLQAIGDRLKITRERVRQIEDKAKQTLALRYSAMTRTER